MAEAVLAGLPEAAGWKVDSAGTADYHVGHAPDHRTLAVLARHGLYTSHRGRQVESADFLRFNWILAMDRANLGNLMRMRPKDATANVELLGSFDPLAVTEVPDPYYTTGLEPFEAVYEQCLRGCRGLIASVMTGR